VHMLVMLVRAQTSANRQGVYMAGTNMSLQRKRKGLQTLGEKGTSTTKNASSCSTYKLFKLDLVLRP